MNELLKNLYSLFDAAYEENMNGRGTDITRMVTTYIPAVIQNLQAFQAQKEKSDPVYISYIYNRKKCDFCDPEGPCYHTTDIRFAANFKEVAPGKWVEKEYDLNGG